MLDLKRNDVLSQLYKLRAAAQSVWTEAVNEANKAQMDYSAGQIEAYNDLIEFFGRTDTDMVHQR